MAGQQALKKEVLSALEQAEARLGEKVRAGNAEVIEQMCQLQKRASRSTCAMGRGEA